MRAVISVALFILAFFFCVCGVLAIMSGLHEDDDLVKMTAYSGGAFMCIMGLLIVAVGVGVMR